MNRLLVRPILTRNYPSVSRDKLPAVLFLFMCLSARTIAFFSLWVREGYWSRISKRSSSSNTNTLHSALHSTVTSCTIACVRRWRDHGSARTLPNRIRNTLQGGAKVTRQGRTDSNHCRTHLIILQTHTVRSFVIPDSDLGYNDNA